MLSQCHASQDGHLENHSEGVLQQGGGLDAALAQCRLHRKPHCKLKAATMMSGHKEEHVAAHRLLHMLACSLSSAAICMAAVHDAGPEATPEGLHAAHLKVPGPAHLERPQNVRRMPLNDWKPAACIAFHCACQRLPWMWELPAAAAGHERDAFQAMHCTLPSQPAASASGAAFCIRERPPSQHPA